MGQTRSRKITRRRKTRKGGGIYNTVLKRVTQRLPTAMPYARGFSTTGALFAPDFDKAWTRPGSRVPQEFIETSTQPAKLRDIIKSHTRNTSTSAQANNLATRRKIPELRALALQEVRSQGLLIPTTVPEPEPKLEPVPAPAPANGPGTNLVKTITKETGQPISVALAESSTKVKEMTEQTLGTAKQATETYKQVTPQKAKELGLNGVPDNANTLSIRTLLANYTIHPIVKIMKVTPKNRREFLKSTIGVTNKNITGFEESALDTLKVILENTSRREVVEMATVFTPQRMRRFKNALFNVFVTNPHDAKKVLDIFFSDILARRHFSPGSIDSLITAMQIEPSKALDIIRSESSKISTVQSELSTQKEIAEAKGMGWFRARTFYVLLLAGLGAIPLFIMFWNGIYTPESFVFHLRQHYAQGSLNGSVQLPFSEILNEGRVFFDALTLRMMEVHEQIAGTNVGRSVAEQTQTLKGVASAKYQEFTEPARPLTVYERLTRYISDQYSYFTGSNPPSEMR